MSKQYEYKIEEKFNQIYQIIKELHPSAISIEIFIDHKGMIISSKHDSRDGVTQYILKTSLIIKEDKLILLKPY